MTTTFKAALQEGLQKMQLSLSEEALSNMETYAAQLQESNQVMNLTAITEPQEIARLHFLDSIAVGGVIPLCGKTLIDIGTGAGFPGLPLKLTIPSLTVTLLDSQQKRIHFLEKVVDCLCLSGVELKHGRAEELSRSNAYRDHYDVAVSRAVADLRLLCELCLPFVTVGGYFLAMKSDNCIEEVERAEKAITTLGGKRLPAYRYTVPGTEICRQVIPIQKVLPTPQAYPRRFAKMQKNPL